MNVHLNEELLSAFLDGEVTAEERLQIEAQLAESPDWQRRYRQLVETVNLVRTLPSAPLEKDFSRDILSVARSRQAPSAANSAVPETMATQALRQPAAAVPTGVSPVERSTAERTRQRRHTASPVMYAVAACAVFVLGIGLVYQAGLFSGNVEQLADQSGEQPAPEHLATSPESGDATSGGDDAEIGPVPEVPGPQIPETRFPTVEELARDQSTDPSIPPEGVDSTDSPVRMNIRVRRKPNEMPTGSNTPAQPGVLARSSMQLDRQDDLGFDQVELPRISDPDAIKEFSAWLDSNQDGRISDLEAQQVWSRFIEPSQSETPLSETALAAIDQNDDEKLTPAELHAAVASLRWYAGETAASLQKFWHRLDANGDQVWSSDDFAANQRWAGGRSAALGESLAQWHALVDRSHNGKVTAVEFALSADVVLQNLQAWEQSILNPQSYQKTRALLDTYDRNRDDQLSGRELRRFQQEETDLAETVGQAPSRGLSAYQLYLAVEAQELDQP